jgi:hypothetical protein
MIVVDVVGYERQANMGSGQGNLIETFTGTPEECADRCRQNDLCAAFTYFTSRGNCKLKSALGDQNAVTGRDTYVKLQKWEIFSEESNMFCANNATRIGAPGWSALGFHDTLELCAQACKNSEGCKFAAWRTDSGQGQCNGWVGDCNLSPNDPDRRFIVVRMIGNTRRSLTGRLLKMMNSRAGNQIQFI